MASYASEANTLRAGVEALLEALIEGEPGGIVACGVERKHDLEPSGGVASRYAASRRPVRGSCRRRAASCPFRASASGCSRRRGIAPEDDSVGARLVDDAQGAPEVRVGGHGISVR